MCPIECVRAACPDPTWLEKHESFILTITASASALVGVLLAYCIKSRCTKIKCCGVELDRDPVNFNLNENVNVQSVNVQ